MHIPTEVIFMVCGTVIGIVIALHTLAKDIEDKLKRRSI